VTDADSEIMQTALIEAWTLLKSQPYYQTKLGSSYLGDSEEIMKEIESESVDLIITSPPYALIREKDYGNVTSNEYINWFQPFADEFYRILKPDGSFVLNIGGSWVKGEPSKSLYTYDLLLDLCRNERHPFKLAQDLYWYNPAKLPAPAEWVTVRRIRVKDSIEFLWWFSKSKSPKADNNRVLKQYSKSMEKLLKNGYQAKLRPSGHDISKKFSTRHKGAIPSNLIVASNTDSNSRYMRKCREYGIQPHPAKFTKDLPDFFINYLTDRRDKVLDPFGGSNVTGMVAEKLGRRWMCLDNVEEYLFASQFRFKEEEVLASIRNPYKNNIT